LSAYEGILLYYDNDIADKTIICKQVKTEFDATAHGFVALMEESRLRGLTPTGLLLEAVPSVVNFKRQLAIGQRCDARGAIARFFYWLGDHV
jgi:hypothetical protein